MPHLHLSLQAGDDMVLKRMKRRHLRADAIAFCDQVRRLRPDVAFGADIIAGFPTETDDDVRALARPRRRLRPDVPACVSVFARAPARRRRGCRRSRAAWCASARRRLREKGDAALRARLATEVGQARDVLIESATQGRTEHFLPVMIEGAAPGSVQRLTIGGCNENAFDRPRRDTSTPLSTRTASTDPAYARVQAQPPAPAACSSTAARKSRAHADAACRRPRVVPCHRCCRRRSASPSPRYARAIDACGR